MGGYKIVKFVKVLSLERLHYTVSSLGGGDDVL